MDGPVSMGSTNSYQRVMKEKQGHKVGKGWEVGGGFNRTLVEKGGGGEYDQNNRECMHEILKN